MKVGDRVKIKSDIYSLSHRKNRNGRIMSIDGSYIMVKPMWCKWKVELYPNEIEVLNGRGIQRRIKSRS